MQVNFLEQDQQRCCLSCSICEHHRPRVNRTATTQERWVCRPDQQSTVTKNFP